MRFKSLSLALSALVLTLAGSAGNAAELEQSAGVVAPALRLKAPPPSTRDKLEACTMYGEGFIRSPGLATCWKLSMDLTYEMKLDLAKYDLQVETTRIVNTPIAFYDRVSISRSIDQFATRTDPRFGMMTVSGEPGTPLVSYMSFRSGPNLTAADARSGSGSTPSFSLTLDQTWLKFSGITAGLHPSFFNYMPGYTYSGGYASTRNLWLVSYTQKLGTMVNATVSVEDKSQRQSEDGVWAAYSGLRSPAVVGQLRIDPAWWLGFHAAGAVHEIRDSIGFESKWGGAFNFGAEAKVRWADVFGQVAGASAGRLMGTFAHARGAIDYLGTPRLATDYASDSISRVRMTDGNSAVISYEHVWTPKLKSTLAFSTYRMETKVANFDYKVAGNLMQAGVEYMPRTGLMVGAEVNRYQDSMRGIYFGVPADRDRVDFVTAFAYIRRRI